MNAPTPIDRLLLPEFDVAQLDALEEEAIFILRETAAAFERPALLFSGGKDSCVVLHLAQKAFKLAGAPKSRLPFPLLHVDTGHNFPEVIAFRDRIVAELGEQLIIAQRTPERDADGGDRRAPLRRAHRRRPTRRREGTRQGAHPVAPRQLRPVAAEEPAARAVAPL